MSPSDPGLKSAASECLPHDASTQLSARRTGMSYQRTRMSADRTLMSVIRTSLSLISFGFTIFQFFEKMKDSGLIEHASAGRNFGTALVALGILMLVLGIFYHVNFMLALRRDRDESIEVGLIRGHSPYPVSMTLIVACALLLLGILTIASMVFGFSLFA